MKLRKILTTATMGPPTLAMALAILSMTSAAPVHAGMFDGRIIMSIPVGAQTFSIEQAIKGSDGTEERCALVPDGFWIESDGMRECLRVYKGGFSEYETPPDEDTANAPPPLREAVFSFHGDIIRGGIWQGLRAEMIAPGTYTSESPQSMEAAAAGYARIYKTPFFWISRLGVYGSSGEYFETNRKRSLPLFSKLLDQIKARFNLDKLHLIGQSAGGSLVAGLISLRTDVGCAVMSSPNADTRRHAGYASYGGWQDYFNPASSTDRIAKTTAPRIFVLSDPNDRQVAFSTQRSYVDALRRAGLTPVHIMAKASDVKSHSLAQWGTAAMTLCLRGSTDDAIKTGIEHASGRIDMTIP